MKNRSMPPGDVIPELACEDIVAVADWLCRAFGFAERLRIGSHRIQMTFGTNSLVLVEGRTQTTDGVMLRARNVDASYATAIAAGALSVRPPADYPFGERQCTVLDPSGRRWTVSQSIADVDPRDWGGELR